MKADPGGSAFFACQQAQLQFDRTKEVMDHGKITAGSEERSKKTEEQKEIGIIKLKHNQDNPAQKTLLSQRSQR